MNINDRRAVPSPSMKPLSPSPSIPPSTSTSQTAAAAPGVVVQQPVPQQAYVPSYRVSLFGEQHLSLLSVVGIRKGATDLQTHCCGTGNL